MSDNDFLKVPGFDLRISPEWAEAMGLDPQQLEPAEFTAGELQQWSTDPGGLMDHTDEAVGYVYQVDRDTGSIGASSGSPIDADDPSGPVLLYRLATMIGAQPSVAECWPRSILQTSHKKR